MNVARRMLHGCFVNWGRGKAVDAEPLPLTKRLDLRLSLFVCYVAFAALRKKVRPGSTACVGRMCFLASRPHIAKANSVTGRCFCVDPIRPKAHPRGKFRRGPPVLKSVAI